MKIKNILILAGGDSSRFWPLHQKFLYNFIGKPLLTHIIERIKPYCENLFVTTSPNGEDHVAQIVGDTAKIAIQKNLEEDMAGATMAASDLISGEVIILNAGDYFNFDKIDDIIKKVRAENSEMLLTGMRMKEYFPGGYFKLASSGKIQTIVEKPAPEDVPSDLVRMVADYFKDFPEFVEALEKLKGASGNLYELGLNSMVSAKKNVDLFAYEDYWHALKYPWNVLAMMNYFLHTLGENEVRLGKNVQVAKTAKIVGPVYIGDNTIIGDFAMVRESQIGANSLIGAYSEVTRSYLGDNVYLHRNYVGDSVLADGVFFGAQAVTANFRFDGKSINSYVAGQKIDSLRPKLGAIVGAGSKIGVNSTILPGIKIGRRVYVGPGETIYQDLEDNKFVLKGEVTENKTI